MPKTVIEKCKSPSPNVTVFSVSGTLGFHEKDTLAKLLGECKKRRLNRVVFDVEGLTSLGGGCANIIRDEAAKGELVIGIARAKSTVLKFLNDDSQRIVIAETVDEVAQRLEQGAEPKPAKPAKPVPAAEKVAAAKEEVIDTTAKAGEAGEDASSLLSPVMTSGDHTVIILGLDPEPDPGVEEELAETEAPVKPEASAGRDVPAGEPARPANPTVVKRRLNDTPPAEPGEGNSNKELRKRIFQYNTIFSLVSDFYRITDRTQLLDVFLLSTIAQVGVESAVFLQYNEGYFTPAAAKGLEKDELRGLAISAEHLNLDGWKETLDVQKVDSVRMPDECKAPLLSIGCSYIAPFVVRGEFRGILGLGKPVRSTLDEGTIEFLKIMINQAAIAYESTRRFEEEKQRTLGLVQTLISLIEENTLARGNTNLISNYTHLLAQKLLYPEESVRDLMYGTVLRDIGMIKVSDLIVRSPRELMPEEWEIIKRHPIEGGEMLRKMKFSEHAVGIVLAHHERFNGEGYPRGLQGKQIPMGARIVSIVESYAAMLQDRPTRPSLTHEEALNTLKENWGMRYDPDVVTAFAEVVQEELRSGEKSYDMYFELSKI